MKSVQTTLVEGAAELIELEFPMLAGVDDLADRLGVSKCHLIRSFTAERGISPGRYLIATRLQAVKSYLATSRFSVETIAGLTGFACGNYLAKVFRRETGCSPSEYRRLHGGTIDGSLLQRRSDDISYI